MSEERCLHCDINEVVREHIDGPEDQWSNLLAEAMHQIGDAFLEKSGATQSDTTH